MRGRVSADPRPPLRRGSSGGLQPPRGLSVPLSGEDSPPPALFGSGMLWFRSPLPPSAKKKRASLLFTWRLVWGLDGEMRNIWGLGSKTSKKKAGCGEGRMGLGAAAEVRHRTAPMGWGGRGGGTGLGGVKS